MDVVRANVDRWPVRIRPGGQRRRGEHQCGRAVVDDEGVLGLGHGGEQGLACSRCPRAASTGGEVELDVDGAGRRDERVPGGRGQRRPAQVGVQHDAGRVEHRAQCGGPRRQGLERGVDDPVRGQVARPHPVLRRGHGGAHQVAAQGAGGVLQARVGEHRVGARHRASRVGRVVLGHRSSSRLAEADGNRTHQAELLDFTGVEDREGHQAPVRLRW